ncbi:hypothetical protein [Desulfobacter sp.]|uniref:hypothetical protein n=1 Tax=Desulfobacter sp. TaxID=2294 RepID=UPI003D0A2299
MDGDLEIRTYKGATEALKALFQLEKEFPNNDIVLVKADSSEEVRYAFKNYFTDAKDFIRLLEEACQALCGEKVLDAKSIINAIEQNSTADPES